ncbi:hypothetical protein SCLCIDRAFT_1159795 [Scleroderma citrinum Foug A]|uniref:Uncharacterized protein n=1 Tax=Scleroderma citrinum Foug A TaxID=1036808 RepID=A0A0C3D8Q0_9AGAM|nr:hypothetical protein SCLCIDRAFT_1159795 [Scleroderma citrinum Foug A]
MATIIDMVAKHKVMVKAKGDSQSAINYYVRPFATRGLRLTGLPSKITLQVTAFLHWCHVLGFDSLLVPTPLVVEVRQEIKGAHASLREAASEDCASTTSRRFKEPNCNEEESGRGFATATERGNETETGRLRWSRGVEGLLYGYSARDGDGDHRPSQHSFEERDARKDRRCPSSSSMEHGYNRGYGETKNTIGVGRKASRDNR